MPEARPADCRLGDKQQDVKFDKTKLFVLREAHHQLKSRMRGSASHFVTMPAGYILTAMCQRAAATPSCPPDTNVTHALNRRPPISHSVATNGLQVEMPRHKPEPQSHMLTH
jgi:hypothetical protein